MSIERTMVHVAASISSGRCAWCLMEAGESVYTWSFERHVLGHIAKEREAKAKRLGITSSSKANKNLEGGEAAKKRRSTERGGAPAYDAGDCRRARRAGGQ